MAELDVQIGKRLQVARKALGFKSARSFARKHSIPESTYSQHETGKRSLNPTTMLTYCGHLNVNPGWLVTGEQANPANTNSTGLDVNLLRSVLQNTMTQITQPELRAQIDQIIDRCITSYLNGVNAKQKAELISAG